MPISTNNPRGRAANSGSKPRLGQARAADSWIPGERDMSSPPFCMKGFDFILEVLPLSKHQKWETGSVSAKAAGGFQQRCRSGQTEPHTQQLLLPWLQLPCYHPAASLTVRSSRYIVLDRKSIPMVA